MDKLLILLFLTILSMPLISCSNQKKSDFGWGILLS